MRLKNVAKEGEREGDLLKDTVIINMNGRPRQFAKYALGIMASDSTIRAHCIAIVENR